MALPAALPLARAKVVTAGLGVREVNEMFLFVGLGD
jgi:hypothetical protein